MPHNLQTLIPMVTGPVLAFLGAFWAHRVQYAKILRALANALDTPAGTTAAKEAELAAVALGVAPAVASTLANSASPAVLRAEQLLAQAKAAKRQ